jgi:hypothetical protein
MPGKRNPVAPILAGRPRCAPQDCRVVTAASGSEHAGGRRVARQWVPLRASRLDRGAAAWLRDALDHLRSTRTGCGRTSRIGGHGGRRPRRPGGQSLANARPPGPRDGGAGHEVHRRGRPGRAESSSCRARSGARSRCGIRSLTPGRSIEPSAGTSPDTGIATPPGRIIDGIGADLLDSSTGSGAEALVGVPRQDGRLWVAARVPERVGRWSSSATRTSGSRLRLGRSSADGAPREPARSPRSSRLAGSRPRSPAHPDALDRYRAMFAAADPRVCRVLHRDRGHGPDRPAGGDRAPTLVIVGATTRRRQSGTVAPSRKPCPMPDWRSLPGRHRRASNSRIGLPSSSWSTCVDRRAAPTRRGAARRARRSASMTPAHEPRFPPVQELPHGAAWADVWSRRAGSPDAFGDHLAPSRPCGPRRNPDASGGTPPGLTADEIAEVLLRGGLRGSARGQHHSGSLMGAIRDAGPARRERPRSEGVMTRDTQVGSSAPGPRLFLPPPQRAGIDCS